MIHFKLFDNIKEQLKATTKTHNGLPIYELEFNDDVVPNPKLFITDEKTGETTEYPIDTTKFNNF